MLPKYREMDCSEARYDCPWFVESTAPDVLQIKQSLRGIVVKVAQAVIYICIARLLEQQRRRLKA